MADLFGRGVLRLKAQLLSGATTTFRDNMNAIEEKQRFMVSGDRDNLHGNPWVFLRLGDSSRVRMTLTNDAPRFVLEPVAQDGGRVALYDILTGELLATDVMLETPFVHCPKHLFFGLYEYCAAGCLFCPLSFRKSTVAYSADEMIVDLDRHMPYGVESIGITTGVPPGKNAEQVGIELATIVRRLFEIAGKSMPIGVSTKHPSKDVLYRLREAGAVEARLNIEVNNSRLAERLMPNKHLDDILLSIEYACDVFGRGNVSSNMIIGVGESDRDVTRGIEELAKLGAIATLYPYDPIPENDKRIRAVGVSEVGIPSAERLISLAIEHKRILAEYGLEGSLLKTMCPACAASHIMPGRDL